MSDETNLNPQQKEYIEKLKNAKVVLDAVNKQRKESVEYLKKKNQDLQDSDKMTMEHLGTPAAVDIVRTMAFALNSACQALDSHDKIIDMLINDLIGCMNNLRKSQEALYELSASEETALRTLMKKGIVTEDELRASYNELVGEMKKEVSPSESQTPPDMS